MATKHDERAMIEKKHARPPGSPFSEMERYFEDFLRNPFSMLSRGPWQSPSFAEGDVPLSADIFEEDGNLVITAELPGMDKDDIHVSMTEQALTISGEKKKEEKIERNNYYRVERSYGSFHRSIQLPDSVDSDHAHADFKNGILKITVPKSSTSKQKQIPVS